MIKQQISKVLRKALIPLGITEFTIVINDTPSQDLGDYSTNIALIAAKKLGKDPMSLADQIKIALKESGASLFKDITVIKPGFINFWIQEGMLFDEMKSIAKSDFVTSSLTGKEIMVEYAHPNTHKEMHIGHLRTLVLGESLARLCHVVGGKVFRANYQGDIGLHVAKAIFGIKKLLVEKQITLEQAEKWDGFKKAHFLGQGYALGSREYEDNKNEIDTINNDIYAKKEEVMGIYEVTRQWSLEYFDGFYKAFYTSFDKLFFESEVAQSGKTIVRKYIGTVFEEANGAVIFPGEKFGLHTRVFITNKGNPTYEGKDIGLGFYEYKTFPFDRCMHIVSAEQTGYFQVVIKALNLIDPEKFEGEYHLPMGMVQLKDKKMSSRTGDVLTIDWLLEQVRGKVGKMTKVDRVGVDEMDVTVEQLAVGAIKYSLLKVGPSQGVVFDIEKSVSLDGDSGPYIQYTFSRTQSVLSKVAGEITGDGNDSDFKKLSLEERQLLLHLSKFNDVLIDSAEKSSPNIMCNYLFQLAQIFNLFYQKYPILKADKKDRDMRLLLTAKTGEVLQFGLDTLGIKAPLKI